MRSLILLLILTTQAYGVTLKVASMAPDGSSWGDALKKLSRRIKKETKGAVKIKMYLGGTAGDEPNVLRQIRIQKMNGGVFTGVALGTIHGDIRVMEIPFTFFRDRQKAWTTLQKGKDLFNKGFSKKGFRNLGFLELGPVYLVSTKKVNNIQELKGQKIWSYSGDELSKTMIESMDLVGVPLALQNVLTSLSTGMIDTAYSSPLGIVALQWHSKIKYLVDFPVTFAVGALLVSDKAWKKIPKEYQGIVEKICQEELSLANQNTIRENKVALDTLKKLNIKFLEFPKKDIEKGKEIRTLVVEKLSGKLFSNEAVEFLKKAIQ